jgi:hypothetical protein
MYGINLKTATTHCTNALLRFDPQTAAIVDDCCNSYIDRPANDDNQLVPEAIPEPKACELHRFCNDDEICVDLPNSDYTCRCKDGFERDQKSQNCVDIDECTTGTNSCSKSEICRNLVGSHECVVCPSGFRPGKMTSAEDFECIDIDECEEESPCDSETTCRNTQGSYKCESMDVQSISCKEGYRMAGDDCVDVNECKEGGCEGNGVCTNLKGGFRCEKIECGEGFINYPRR